MLDVSARAPGVYLQEVSGVRPISGVGTALPAFVGLAPRGPTTPTVVANWTQFTETFGDVHEGMALAKAVFAYLANGGSTCLVVRVGGGGEQAPQAASADVTGAAGGTAFVVTAKQAGAGGNSIKVVVGEPAQPPAAQAPPADEDSDDDSGDDGGTTAQGGPAAAQPAEGAQAFDLTIVGPDEQEESYSRVTAATVRSQLERSRLVSVSAAEGASVARPSPGTTTLAGGSDGSAISVEAFLGDEADETGLAGLVAVDEVTMVAAPDLVTAQARGTIGEDAVRAVQTAMIDHCESLKDRMAIIDPPLYAPGGSQGGKTLSAQEVLAWRDGLTSSKFAAAYYPWVTVFDAGSQQLVPEPPSGYVAGVWARTDAERGVSVAPTGRVRGAVGLARILTDPEQGLLNPRGVNCLRVFRGSGPVVWGARTLSDDSEWRYLNVRRLFNYLEESVVEGTKFAVFEPNDRALWAKLRRSITAFMLGLWRQGALVGATPDEAFYVRCDDETNPSDQVDLGIVTVEIGAAPSKPAEFVVIRVRQSTDGTAVAE